MSRQAEVGIHQHSPRPIQRRSQLLSQRRGRDSRSPQNDRGRPSRFPHLYRPRLYSGHHGRGMHLHAQPPQLFLGAAREIFGIRRQDPRAPFQKHNPGFPRIDAPKFVGQRPASNLGQRPRQFHSRGTAPHYHEVELHLLFSVGRLALRQLKRQQHAPPDFQRIFDRLQAGRKRLPIIVAEIGMARARSHNQVVVGHFSIRQLHHFERQIEVLYFRHQYFDIPPAAQNPANRRRNFSRRQSGGRHLVKQRLESMKVLAIDQRNSNRISGHRAGRQQPAKAPSNNHHSRIGFRIHRYIIRFTPSLRVSKTCSQTDNRELITDNWFYSSLTPIIIP